MYIMISTIAATFALSAKYLRSNLACDFTMASDISLFLVSCASCAQSSIMLRSFALSRECQNYQVLGISFSSSNSPSTPITSAFKHLQNMWIMLLTQLNQSINMITNHSWVIIAYTIQQADGRNLRSYNQGVELLEFLATFLL